MFGLKPEQVKLHMLYAGGSFGRRANPHSDYVLEAAHIVKAIGGKAPVKLVWTREDDTRAGWYRPMFFHALRAGLDADGNLVAWHHRLVGQSILAGTPFEGSLVKNGIDRTSVEGANNSLTRYPTWKWNCTRRVCPFRCNGGGLWVPGHTGFSTESFIDQAAHAAGRDPYHSVARC